MLNNIVKKMWIETKDGTDYYPAHMLHLDTGIKIPFGKVCVPFHRAEKMFAYYVKVDEIPKLIKELGGNNNDS